MGAYTRDPKVKDFQHGALEAPDPAPTSGRKSALAQTDADKAVAKFPDVSEFAKVEKFPTKGASKVLIQVKLVHGGDSESPGIRRLTETTAKIIGDVVQKLGSKFGTKSFYQDGITADSQKQFIQSAQDYVNAKTIVGMYNQALKQGIPKAKLDETVSHMANSLSAYQNAVKSFESHATYDAAYKLVVEGWKLHVTEDTKLHRESRAEAEKNDVSPKFMRLSEKREDNLLQRVAKDPASVQIAVYGAMHDFRNNIAAYNRTHPNDKIALVVVTPKTIPSDLKNLKKLLDSL